MTTFPFGHTLTFVLLRTRQLSWIRVGMALAALTLIIRALEQGRKATAQESKQTESVEYVKKELAAARQEAAWQKHRADMASYSIRLSEAQRRIRVGNYASAETILENCPWDLRNFEHRYLWSLCQKPKFTLLGHTGNIACVAFSPDGKRLASAGWNLDHELAPGQIKV